MNHYPNPAPRRLATWAGALLSAGLVAGLAAVTPAVLGQDSPASSDKMLRRIWRLDFERDVQPDEFPDVWRRIVDPPASYHTYAPMRLVTAPVHSGKRAFSMELYGGSAGVVIRDIEPRTERADYIPVKSDGYYLFSAWFTATFPRATPPQHTRLHFALVLYDSEDPDLRKAIARVEAPPMRVDRDGWQRVEITMDRPPSSALFLDVEVRMVSPPEEFQGTVVVDDAVVELIPRFEVAWPRGRPSLDLGRAGRTLDLRARGFSPGVYNLNIVLRDAASRPVSEDQLVLRVGNNGTGEISTKVPTDRPGVYLLTFALFRDDEPSVVEEYPFAVARPARWRNAKFLLDWDQALGTPASVKAGRSGGPGGAREDAAPGNNTDAENQLDEALLDALNPFEWLGVGAIRSPILPEHDVGDELSDWLARARMAENILRRRHIETISLVDPPPPSELDNQESPTTPQRQDSGANLPQPLDPIDRTSPGPAPRSVLPRRLLTKKAEKADILARDLAQAAAEVATRLNTLALDDPQRATVQADANRLATAARFEQARAESLRRSMEAVSPIRRSSNRRSELASVARALELEITHWQTGADEERELERPLSERLDRLAALRAGLVAAGLSWARVGLPIHPYEVGTLPGVEQGGPDFVAVVVGQQAPPALPPPGPNVPDHWVVLEALDRHAANLRTRGADMIKRFVQAARTGADRVIVAKPRHRSRGLLRSSGEPTALFFALSEASRRLAGSRFLGERRYGERGEVVLSLFERDAVLANDQRPDGDDSESGTDPALKQRFTHFAVVWREGSPAAANRDQRQNTRRTPATRISGYLGRDLEQIDLFGDRRPLASKLGVTSLSVGDEPLLIDGVSHGLILTEAELTLSPDFVRAQLEPAQLELRIRNHFDLPVEIRNVSFEPPPGIEILPQQPSLTLEPGTSAGLPLKVTVRPNAASGRKTFRALLDIVEGGETWRVEAPLSLELRPDISVRLETLRNQSGEPDGVLVVIRNEAEVTLDLSISVDVEGSAPQQSFQRGVRPGEERRIGAPLSLIRGVESREVQVRIRAADRFANFVERLP